MRPKISKLWLPLSLTAVAAWMAFQGTSLGDYPSDAAPAVEALAHGRIAVYLEANPIMGPFATIFEAMFAVLGKGTLGEYHWVCLGCLLSGVALGWYLAEVARRRGVGLIPRTAIALLCVVNPIGFEALRAGHPEELLTAALAIFAVALAIDRRQIWPAAVCLGLAIATKQWAILAIFPVLMVLPARRIRAASLALAVVAALYLPALAFAPGAFMEIQSHAASGGHLATIWSVWFPVSPATPRVLENLGTVAMVHEQPTAIQPLTHILIVALMLGVPLALWARRGTFHLDGTDGLALFALLALLRCAFDPVDNFYYHAPVIVALFAWDAYSAERLPLRGLAAVAVSLLFWKWSRELGSFTAFNAVYLLVILAAGTAIAASLSRRGPREVAERRVAMAPGRA